MNRIAGILTKAGFAVELVGREKKTSVAPDLLPYKQTRLRCFFEKGKLFYLEYNLRLFWYLLRKKADVYGAIDLDTLLANTVAAGLKRKKLVFDAHEHFTEVPELQGRPLSQAVWNLVADTCISKADKAYTVGPELARLFSQKYGIAFETILNVPAYQGLPPVKEVGNLPVILYQGALNQGRGLPQLINAMKHVNATLKIAGEGDLSLELRNLTNNLGLQNKVQFLGFVKPADLPALTASASIACNLLEPKGLSYQYSLANKFFDAIHAGVPQLCADFVEYRHINSLYEVALLCHCNEREIVDAINKLLKDKDLYRRLQQNCAKAAGVYNLQHEAEKLIRIYQSLSL